MTTEQIKDLITCLESNNQTIKLVVDDSKSVNVDLMNLQIEMNNKQIQQLQLLLGIETI